MFGFFTIKINLFVCLMSFVKQCDIFRTFTLFSFGNLMKQLNNDELKVNIHSGHGLQIHDQVIKRWGKAHRSTMHMYTSSSSIFTSMERN